MSLQMKLKQKIGVAAIFCLGFLVVIASSGCLYSTYTLGISLIHPVIRAYYSKRNETMLTCTVSMIETAVAIIATCLPRTSSSPQSPNPSHLPTNTPCPALRTVILGHSSTAGNNSGYRHYELSSAGHHRSQRTHQSRITTNIIGGTQLKENDSEDELVAEPGHLAAPSGSSSMADDKNNGIMVSTTFEVESGMHRDSTAGYHARA